MPDWQHYLNQRPQKEKIEIINQLNFYLFLIQLCAIFLLSHQKQIIMKEINISFNFIYNLEFLNIEQLI